MAVVVVVCIILSWNGFDKCKLAKFSHRLICSNNIPLWEKDREVLGVGGLSNDYGNLEYVQGYTGEAIYLI